MEESNEISMGQQTCLLTFVCVLLTVSFMVGPGKNIFLVSSAIKIVILCLLGYLVCIVSNSISKNVYNFDGKSKDYISTANRNIVFKISYVIMLLILFVMVCRTFFISSKYTPNTV